jgi:hypothetical protein
MPSVSSGRLLPGSRVRGTTSLSTSRRSRSARNGLWFLRRASRCECAERAPRLGGARRGNRARADDSVSDVRGFFAALGVVLPASGGVNVAVRCFAEPAVHAHSDRQRSASVNVQTGAWCCFACGAKGGAYDAALALGRAPADAMALLRQCGLVETDGAQPQRRRASKSDRARRLDTSSAAVRFTPTEEGVSAFAAALASNEPLLARLNELRGWTRGREVSE